MFPDCLLNFTSSLSSLSSPPNSGIIPRHKEEAEAPGSGHLVWTRPQR